MSPRGCSEPAARVRAAGLGARPGSAAPPCAGNGIGADVTRARGGRLRLCREPGSSSPGRAGGYRAGELLLNGCNQPVWAGTATGLSGRKWQPASKVIGKLTATSTTSAARAQCYFWKKESPRLGVRSTPIQSCLLPTVYPRDSQYRCPCLPGHSLVFFLCFFFFFF